MRNKVHSITESRIHGDMYVRFGGRFGETCGSNAVRRSEPSLHICYCFLLLSRSQIKSSIAVDEVRRMYKSKINLFVSLDKESEIDDIIPLV